MPTTPMSTKRPPHHLLLPALLGAVLVAVLIIVRRGSGPAESETGLEGPAFPAADGPLTISVTESGTIKPREQLVLKSEVQGRTTILYLIPEGSHVKEGELLVELDAGDIEDNKVDQEIRVQNAEAAFVQSRENLAVVKNQAKSDVDKAELTLRFATEDLQQYKEGEYPNLLKEQQAKITLAEEESQRAKQKLKWSRVLFEEEYLSESELDADKLAGKKAELDVELARNNLELLQEFTYKRKIAQLESDVKQAEMALERVRRKASADVVQAEADLRAKESEFRRQTSKLNKLKEQIAKAKIYAPRAGLVVYATSARASWRGNTEPLDEGQEVRERQELIYLPTASTFMASVKVHESNLDKIDVGLPCRITVDALPGREFTGKVAVIAPLPDAMSVFMNPDLKVYNTEIHIDGGDLLRTGMSCKAEIIVKTFDRALYVPVQAIVQRNGQATAYVRTSSGFEPRHVETGLDNNRMVRILSGLQSGEEVLLTPPLQQSAAPAAPPTSLSGSPEKTAPPAPPGDAAPPTPAAAGPVGGQHDTAGNKRRADREGQQHMSPAQRQALNGKPGAGTRHRRPKDGPTEP